MPTFARRPSTMSSQLLVEIPQNSIFGQQRQQISELQFDKFLTLSTFFCWKMRFKSQVTTCCDFPSGAMLWIKEVVMVHSLDELKFSRSIAGKNHLKLEMLDAIIVSSLFKIIQHYHFKKKVSLEEQKRPERGLVSARKTDHLHDLRLLSSYWRSRYSIGLRRFILCHSSRQ